MQWTEVERSHVEAAGTAAADAIARTSQMASEELCFVLGTGKQQLAQDISACCKAACDELSRHGKQIAQDTRAQLEARALAEGLLLTSKDEIAATVKTAVDACLKDMAQLPATLPATQPATGGKLGWWFGGSRKAATGTRPTAGACAQEDSVKQEVICMMREQGMAEEEIQQTIARVERAGATSTMMMRMDEDIREMAAAMGDEVRAAMGTPIECPTKEHTGDHAEGHTGDHAEGHMDAETRNKVRAATERFGMMTRMMTRGVCHDASSTATDEAIMAIQDEFTRTITNGTYVQTATATAAEMAIRAVTDAMDTYISGAHTDAPPVAASADEAEPAAPAAPADGASTDAPVADARIPDINAAFAAVANAPTLVRMGRTS